MQVPAGVLGLSPSWNGNGLLIRNKLGSRPSSPTMNILAILICADFLPPILAVNIMFMYWEDMHDFKEEWKKFVQEIEHMFNKSLF